VVLTVRRPSLPSPKIACISVRRMAAIRFNRTHETALLLYLLNRIVKGSVRYSKAALDSKPL
jgi:hypothetical protein